MEQIYIEIPAPIKSLISLPADWINSVEFRIKPGENPALSIFLNQNIEEGPPGRMRRPGEDKCLCPDCSDISLKALHSCMLQEIKLQNILKINNQIKYNRSHN